MAKEISKKMPVKTQEIHLTDDYLGWSFTSRTNLTMDTLDDLVSGNFGRIADALAQMVLSWDFVDEEGEALPNPAEIKLKAYADEEGKPLSTDEILQRRAAEIRRLTGRLPIDLTRAMSDALFDAVTKPPPNS